MLAARIPVGPFGHPGDAQVADAEIGQNGPGSAQLAGTAVDEDQIGPGLSVVRARFGRRNPFAMLLEQARETPCQDFAHHAEIVTGNEFFGAYVELAILRFH